ncbi:MAG: Wzz/FepE/Etk N-terminal domain-containing protein [bacterium]
MVKNTEKENPSFIDYVYILVKWRKMIIINFLVVCIVTAIISLIIPKWYKATTTIMPPSEQTTSLGGLSSIMNKLPVGNLGMGNILGFSEQTSRFIAMLESRTIMESVIDEFNLMEKYKQKNIEETIEELRNHVSIKVEEEGTITVGVEAGTPYLSTKKTDNEARNRAKNMTNFFIEELDRINKRMKTSQAHNKRIFIEKRYEQNLKDLKSAEDSLKKFQQRYGVISLPEQTEATISAASELKAQIITKEVELEALSEYFGKSHSETQKVKSTLKALKNKYTELKKGDFDKTIKQNIQKQELFLTLQHLPELGLRFVRLYREVKIQENIQEFLLPVYEEAKIEEARDTPTVQVLDKAAIPIKRHKPQRSLLVLFLGFCSLLLSIIAVFIIENIASLKRNDPEKGEKYNEIISVLKNDISKILHFKRN